MKLLATFIALLTGLNALAGSWYVDNTASGANNGTSWANAWESFADISWVGMSSDDTLFISGGAGGQVYDEALVFDQSNVTISPGRDANHNGLVTISNKLEIGGSLKTSTNIVINGAKSLAYTTNFAMDNLWDITNNIGMRVVSYGGAKKPAIKVSATNNVHILWLDVQGGNNNTNYVDCHGVELNIGANKCSDIEIAYSYIHHSTQDGIYDGDTSSSGLGNVKIHHNLIYQNGDDGIEAVSDLDIYNNFIFPANPYYIEDKNHPDDTLDSHPDAIQDPGINLRIYNNKIVSGDNSAIYLQTEPPASWSNRSNVFVYGNVCYSLRTNDGPYNQGDLLSIHAKRSGNAVETHITNQWYVVANNTIYLSYNNDGMKVCAFVPVSGDTNFPNSTWVVTNCFVYNNALEDLNLAAGSPMSFMTGVTADYNTLANDSMGSKAFVVYTNTPICVQGIPYWTTYTTAASYNTAFGSVSNINVALSFVSTNDYDFNLTSADTGARNKGVDLATVLPSELIALMPNYNVDMNGITRGLDGAWDRGAYEYDSSLLLWLTFEDDFTDGQVDDQSGNSRHMLRYGFAANPTNWPTQVAGTNGTDNTALFTPYYETYYPTGQTTYSLGDYGVVTNVGALHDPGLTNMTVAVWAYYYAYSESGEDQNCQMLNAGYGVTDYLEENGCWNLGRDGANRGDHKTVFNVFTNWPNASTHKSFVEFPDDYYNTNDGQSDRWHHYTVTVNVTTHEMIAYFDGVPCDTNTLSGSVSALYVSDPAANASASTFPWLGVGVMTHNGTATLDDNNGGYFPNAEWFHGQMDDIRIYDRVLSAAEIAALGGGEAPEEPPAEPDTRTRARIRWTP